MFLNVKTKRTS